MTVQDSTPNLQQYATYEEACRNFKWRLPEKFNIADAVCSKYPDGATRLALIEAKEGGSNSYTFGAIDFLSDKFANALRRRGIAQGDRVAVILPQSAALPIAHLAVLKLGAVVVPLTTLFGSAALDFRLRDSGARAVVVDPALRPRIADIQGNLPGLEAIFVVRDGDEILDSDSAEYDFWAEVNWASSDFSSVETTFDTPAFILYTSGSTGDPKGAVHGHGFLLGHLTAIEMCYNFDLGDDTVFWTPADWAWVGALFDSLYPAWYYGRPVVANRPAKFSGSAAFAMIERYGVTNAFIPPTALRLMKMDEPNPRSRFDLKLRNIFSGGEALTSEIYEWARETLGTSINEGYGQTEANMLVSNCERWFPARIGSMGRPSPGHTVEIVDERGQILPRGEVGSIALARPDPVLFLGYLNSPEKTAAAFIGDWLLTGDVGLKDSDGYIWFRGRDDDLIKTAAYRIGPTEIERVILQHPDVAECAVVGIPDETRGAIIKAFVRPAATVGPWSELVKEIQELVQREIGRHAYPREVEFVDSLPTTTTGKIRRKELRDREIERKRGEGRRDAGYGETETLGCGDAEV